MLSTWSKEEGGGAGRLPDVISGERRVSSIHMGEGEEGGGGAPPPGPLSRLVAPGAPPR